MESPASRLFCHQAGMLVSACFESGDCCTGYGWLTWLLFNAGLIDLVADLLKPTLQPCAAPGDCSQCTRLLLIGRCGSGKHLRQISCSAYNVA